MTGQRAHLVASPDAGLTLTGSRSVDARTALSRGLAEYLLDAIEIDAEGGRRIRFKHVYQSWAEPEDTAIYPSAVVYASTTGLYDASRFTPGVLPQERLAAPDNRYAVALADFSQDLTLEIWASDPHERMELVNACEQALNPSLIMYGMVLELPYYYNERAVYAMSNMAYQDNETDAIRRHRKASFTISAQVPIIKLVSLPDAKTRLVLAKVGTDVVLDINDP
jgi:hypothetical protein